MAEDQKGKKNGGHQRNNSNSKTHVVYVEKKTQDENSPGRSEPSNGSLENSQDEFLKIKQQYEEYSHGNAVYNKNRTGSTSNNYHGQSRGGGRNNNTNSNSHSNGGTQQRNFYEFRQKGAGGGDRSGQGGGGGGGYHRENNNNSYNKDNQYGARRDNFKSRPQNYNSNNSSSAYDGKKYATRRTEKAEKISKKRLLELFDKKRPMLSAMQELCENKDYDKGFSKNVINPENRNTFILNPDLCFYLSNPAIQEEPIPEWAIDNSNRNDVFKSIN